MDKSKGIAASQGVGIGHAFVLPAWEWDVPEQDIDVGDMANEFERLYSVIHRSKDEIEAMKRDISDLVGDEEKTIFDTHLAILDDPVFTNEIRGIIERQYKAAEVAVKEVIDKFVRMFDLLEDDYMRERAADIKDVGNRLLKHLIGTPDVTLPANNRPFVLVARELTPSQLAHLNPQHVLGLATMAGGRDSHAAIMARSMGIPLVSGLDEAAIAQIETGDELIVDGISGWVIRDPDADTMTRYRQERESWLSNKERLQLIADTPAVTTDGVLISLSANISSLKELDAALEKRADGVGLFRTEFLYMDRPTLPSEDEQFEVYRKAAEKLNGKPLIIRTFDIGGDKQLDSLSLPEEDNPFLGYRAIRISLDRKELFKTQLKAILRAGVFGDIKIMYPMISSVSEVWEANAVVAEAGRELDEAGIPRARKPDVGIMIEVPAAVAIADLLAAEVDFFSIGTNDLIQYVLAADRLNEKIASLYDPFHPAIIRNIKRATEAANERGIPVEVCGEMAGDVRALPIWLALGVKHLSMTPQSVLEVKHHVLRSSAKTGASILERVLACRTGSEIAAILTSECERATQSAKG